MGALQMSRTFFPGLLCCCIMGFATSIFGQTVSINGGGSGRAFEGVGAVSGGGATSPMVKDYAEPYRSQILDYLFKPKFGASINTVFHEIPGDANSTQGSEPSHMHTANDLNFQRGYEWFLMKEAKRRNPSLTLDAVAWGAPGWVGGGNFYSTDMQHYNIQFIKGLKSTYGFNLDAIGCRNENGVNYAWAEQMKDSLTKNGLTTKLHGFDNWSGSESGGEWGFVCDATGGNAALTAAIDVCSAHSTASESAAYKVPSCGLSSNKSFWDTEEHAYYSGYTCEQYIVHDANINYINNKITKTVFWYLIEAYYSVEQFANPHQTMAVASQPWCGHYEIEPALWGYAHINQFVDLGWKFIDNACGNVSGGGTYVTLKSPTNSDFSVIIETQNGSGGTLNFTITGGLPTTKPLCVWMSNSSNQFVKQADITPTNGAFSITVAGNSIYSLSTTTGQQKGAFSAAIPASQAFPVPFYENYDHYTGTDAKLWGYLPYYQCDICGVFEIANSPSGTGKCLRQVLTTKASSWAPEWAAFTLIGNVAGTNYEVSADIYFDNGGWAGVMGRVNQTGTYGCFPRGYYLRLSSTGAWNLGYANGAAGDGSSLASGTATLTGTGWHNVKLQMSGSTLTGLIENKQVCSVTNSQSGNGVAGLYAGTTSGGRNTACFDNLIINTVNGATPTPTVFAQDATPPYSTTTVVAGQPITSRAVPARLSYKVVGGQFAIPKEFSGKTVAALVYDLKGRLMKKVITKTAAINLDDSFNKASEVFIVKLNVAN
jgi:galactosylceramidase